MSCPRGTRTEPDHVPAAEVARSWAPGMGLHALPLSLPISELQAPRVPTADRVGVRLRVRGGAGSTTSLRDPLKSRLSTDVSRRALMVSTMTGCAPSRRVSEDLGELGGDRDSGGFLVRAGSGRIPTSASTPLRLLRPAPDREAVS